MALRPTMYAMRRAICSNNKKRRAGALSSRILFFVLSCFCLKKIKRGARKRTCCIEASGRNRATTDLTHRSKHKALKKLWHAVLEKYCLMLALGSIVACGTCIRPRVIANATPRTISALRCVALEDVRSSGPKQRAVWPRDQYQNATRNFHRIPGCRVLTATSAASCFAAIPRPLSRWRVRSQAIPSVP